MFGDLRKYVALVFSFSQINLSIETAEGLKAYLQWVLNAAQMFGVNQAFIEKVAQVLSDEKTFAILLAVVRYVSAMTPATFGAAEALPGEPMESAMVVEMETGEHVELAAADLQRWLPFVAQLMAFINEIKKLFTVQL